MGFKQLNAVFELFMGDFEQFVAAFAHFVGLLLPLTVIPFISKVMATFVIKKKNTRNNQMTRTLVPYVLNVLA